MELILSLVVLGLIIVIGHVLWLAIAGVLRFLFPHESPVEILPREAEREWRDLEITTRTLRGLLAEGGLDRDTVERLEQCLEARRRKLRPHPPAARDTAKPRAEIPKISRPAPIPQTEEPSVVQLETLLSGEGHPRNWPVHRRQAALACYRRSSNSQRAEIKGPALLALARLLPLAGMTTHALNAYRRWLDEAPEGIERARVALEAGRIALHQQQHETARHFLQLAVAGNLPGDEGEAARWLLRQLGGSAPTPAVEAEEILDVIPVAASEEIAVREVPVTPAPAAPPLPPAPVLVAPPPRPRRSLTNVLAAFMEDRNILWGELAGGLLIVGCSIALVITLWHNLEELPYFPFLLFAGITAALFGAGEYTLHHWKLEATSRGLLVIALLLVPLNLLVLADPTLGRGNSALEWSFKSAAILLALGMIRLASRDLIGVGVLPGPVDRRWLFMLAIVGAAGSQLLVPRWLDEAHPLLSVALAIVPVACHGLACGAVVAGLARARRGAEGQRLEVRQAHALFVFLGLASFALFVALGFLLSRSGDMARALPRLAVPFAWAGVPILAGGLLVLRGLRGSLPASETFGIGDLRLALSRTAGEEGGTRTAGTGVAFSGLALMLSAVVLAWPQPLAVLLVCLSNAAILSVVAFRWRLPAAHAIALPCAALAVLIVVQMLLGNLAHPAESGASAWLAQQILQPSGGIVLAFLMLLLVVAAEGLARAGQRPHALSYALAAGVLGTAALLTTAWHGLEAPRSAALVHALTAACSLAMYQRWRRPVLPYTGFGLFIAASLWLLWAAVPEQRAVWGFVLALEALVLALAAAWPHGLRGACRDVAAATAVLALGLAVFTPDFPAQAWHTGTATVLALTAFLLAGAFRWAELAWAGSILLFAALAHLFIWDLEDAALPRPLLMALLAHASLALLGAVFPPVRSAPAGSLWHRPLMGSAQLTSLLAVPLILAPGIAALTLAGYTFWLALLWLVVAALQRSPAWFTAFQAALHAAVLFAVDAALPGWAWYDPRSLQAYGIGLALLGFGWIAARMLLRPYPLLQQLAETPWPALDRVVLAVLVVGQFALALVGVLPGAIAELTPEGYGSPAWPAEFAHAYGAGAWLLLGALALVLLAALRERGRTSLLLGLLVLAATVPLLAAGPFAAEVATASALRWGLALTYLACSALLWLRRPLARLADAAGVTPLSDSSAVLCAHALLGTLAVSVLVLTLQTALLGFAGLHPSGPAAGSLFAEMGWIVSNVMPLLLLTLALVGHAVRERSPDYAFAAGLLANLSVTGGYALAVVTAGRHLDTVEMVRLLQLASLTAALWALAWQASRRWVRAWREVATADGFVPSPSAAPLMLVQMALAGLLQLLLLGCGVLALTELSGVWRERAAAIGAPLGWLALLASMASLLVWHAQRRRPLPWSWLYLAGLAAIALLACTMERTWTDSGFYTLLLGWPLHALSWAALSLLSLPHPDTNETSAKRIRLSFAGFQDVAPLILLPCVGSLLWALQAAGSRHDYLWAAAAIGLCAAASALLAAGRRSPELAFLAGLGGNLAATLMVWRWYHPLPPSWVALVQANAIASAVVSLLWLGVRRWLGEKRPRTLLALQSLLGFGIQTFLLLLAVMRLAVEPGTPPEPWLIAVGSLFGWAALLIAAAAAYRLCALHHPRGRIHVLGLAGLSAGVLAACTLGPWDTGRWQSFHVLLMSWCILGLALTLLGLWSFAGRFTGRGALLRPQAWRRWLECIGMAIVVLVLPNHEADPLRPLVPALSVAVVCLMAGTLALCWRRQHYVWISGVGLDLIGLLFWLSWGPHTALSFLLMNALGLAVAAAVWTVLDRAWPLALNARPSSLTLRLVGLPFAYVAVNLALALDVLVVGLLLLTDLAAPASGVSEPLAWPCLAAIGAALVLALWDARAAFARPGLYLLGLAAIGLALHEGTHSPMELGWYAALALAAYAVLASLISRLARRGPQDWFMAAQAGVAFVAIALSLWMCLNFAARLDRLAGPAAVMLLVPAAVVLVRRGERSGEWLRPAALVLGALAAAEAGWAWPDPAGPAPWLHRNVLLMAALAVLTVLYGIALPRWLARDADWVRCGRRIGPLLGVLASLILLVLLVQEFHSYDKATRRTPMLWPEILAVLAALIALMVSGIRFAVVPGRDPFGLSERGRTLYVYAVELLLVLLFLHIRLNVPQLFRGWAGRYWTILVMLIAYAGVGLSEYFERRKLRVLAGPLQRTGVFLPLLPLLAFWAKPPAPLLHFADANAPGLQPLLGYLDRLPQHFNSYAFLWLLVCGLYALVSLTRRSFVFALLAALAGNCALWSLLTHHGIAFLLHPQCWLIPPALIVLAAEYVNRERLRPELSAGLRYLGITLIYVSSTADLFLAGLGNSVVLPIVLAMLALAGVLLGILFRVRAFLFLGIGFLFLDVFTMIWYAAVDRYQTWIWWVSGIILGAAILTLFAIFEKRRNDVLRLLEEIKSWN